jgi:hypothetical protein
MQSLAIVLISLWAIAELPLRTVMTIKGERLANCIFSRQQIPPRAAYSTPLADHFSDEDPMFARCYFPDPVPANKPGELTDVLTLDGKPLWKQAYDDAVPAGSLERPIYLGEILRAVRAGIPKGNHLVQLNGYLKRGAKNLRLYHGEFRYQR